MRVLAGSSDGPISLMYSFEGICRETRSRLLMVHLVYRSPHIIQSCFCGGHKQDPKSVKLPTLEILSIAIVFFADEVVVIEVDGFENPFFCNTLISSQ